MRVALDLPGAPQRAPWEFSDRSYLPSWPAVAGDDRVPKNIAAEGQRDARQPSPQSCAIVLTIAHDDFENSPKSPKNVRKIFTFAPDCRKSFCALVSTSAQKDLRASQVFPHVLAMHVQQSPGVDRPDATLHVTRTAAPRRASRCRRRPSAWGSRRSGTRLSCAVRRSVL